MQLCDCSRMDCRSAGKVYLDENAHTLPLASDDATTYLFGKVSKPRIVRIRDGFAVQTTEHVLYVGNDVVDGSRVVLLGLELACHVVAATVEERIELRCGERSKDERLPEVLGAI